MGLIDIIYKWQTLIGAIIGGLFALATAFVVALSMRRREEVASGMIVVSNLAVVRIAFEAINSLQEQEGIEENEYPLWFSDRLVSSCPKLSNLFDAAVARLMPVDVHLAAHLSLFQQIYSMIETMIDKLSADYKYFHEHERPLRPKDHMLPDYKLIARHFPLVVEHAQCAEAIIGKLVLSNFSSWNRLIRIFHLNQKERKCRKILKTGSS